MLLISLALAESIRVGVDTSYPFAYKEHNTWTGVSVELFEEIAEQNTWNIEYIQIPFSEYPNAIETNKIDVYLPAITITAEREEKFDFSYAYFKDYLAITTHDSGSFTDYIKAFVTKSLGALGVMIPILMLVAAIYYLCEKVQRFASLKEELREYFDSIYWAMTTAATVGYGDEAPKTILGRFIAMIWMLLGIMFFSWVITQLGSVSTSDSVQENNIPQNLVAVENTTSALYLREINSVHKTVENDESLQKAYKEGSDICHDQSLIQSLLPEATILRIEEKPQYYGFLFPEESKYIESTNRSLLRVLESKKWQAMRATYLKE